MKLYNSMQVRVCSGKPTTIVASRNGFYPAGKRNLLSHSLVGLLQQLSRVFDAVSTNLFKFMKCMVSVIFVHLMLILMFGMILFQAYKALMKAFVEHNKVSSP